MKNICIAFSNESPPFSPSAGGIASYIQHRAHILSEHGFDVWWFNQVQCARFGVEDRQWTDIHDFPLSGFSKKITNRFPLAGAAARFICHEKGADILELPEGVGGYLPSMRTRRQPKIILHCHTTQRVREFLNREQLPFFTKARRRLNAWPTKRNFYRADSVLACSHFIAFLEAGFYKVHPDYFRVIPHAFHPLAESGFKLKADQTHDNMFLVVGNMEYFKGFDLIMEGFRRYRKNRGPAQLLFAGPAGLDDSNPQVKELLGHPEIRMAMKDAGPDAVRFLGKLSKDRLAKVRARATAVVVGSRFEAFTMVVGEAVLAGCPLILSERTGWLDLAKRYDAARLFCPYDPNDLADAMMEMHEPHARAKYQANSARLAQYLYSQELVSQTVQFYRQAATHP